MKSNDEKESLESLIGDELQDMGVGELYPEQIADLIRKWVSEQEYNFDVRVESANDMELRSDEYDDAIDSDVTDFDADDMFEDEYFDGEFLVRETKPRDDVIVYFFGDEKYNRYAICEECGIYLDSHLNNRVRYEKTIQISPADEEGMTLMDLFGG